MSCLKIFYEYLFLGYLLKQSSVWFLFCIILKIGVVVSPFVEGLTVKSRHIQRHSAGYSGELMRPVI